MSTRAQLSETIHRLLPGEANKRIREAILKYASYSGLRTDQLRQSIDLANRVRTGLLVTGTLNFASPTSATLAGFAWAIDFVVLQQDGPDTITVVAPHATFPRPDIFVGKADGTVVYRAGTLDGLGNATIAAVAPDEVLLSLVARNPDGSNDVTPIDPTVSNTFHSALLAIQGGKPAIGTDPAEYYHLTLTELLKLQTIASSKWSENEDGIYREGRVKVGGDTFSDETAAFEVEGGLRANFLFYQGAANATVTSLSTVTLNLTGGNNTRRYVLQANLTINFSTGFPANIACTYTFIFRQDGTGGKTVTWNTSGPVVLWQGGVAPIIGAAANEITVITIMWTGQEYLGVKSCGFNV